MKTTNAQGTTHPRWFRLVAATAVSVLAGAAALVGLVAPASAQNHQITICHATGSATNPYTSPPIPKKQIFDDQGHRENNENAVHGNDIIPPFSAGEESPGQTWGDFGGQIWDAEGEAIYNGGECDGTYTPPGRPDDLVQPRVVEKKHCDGVFRRTVTTTTAYVWDEEEEEWVLGTPQTDSPDWHLVRELTAEEAAALKCDKPPGPPVVNPPVVNPPVVKPPVVQPPAAPPAITPPAPAAPEVAAPTAVSAGLGEPQQQSPLGAGLVLTGMTLLITAGGLLAGRRARRT